MNAASLSFWLVRCPWLDTSKWRLWQARSSAECQLGVSLERLSHAAANGSLYVDDRLAAKFEAACDDIRAMHLHLLEALGKKPAKTPIPNQRLGIQFAQTAQIGRLQP